MRNWRTWLALIVIAALSWVELQYISESSPDSMEGPIRKSLHIVFLFVVMLTGYWGWYKHPLKWLRNLWILSYSFSIFALLPLWIIASRFHYPGILDFVHNVIKAFISPVPFLILLVFSKMKSLTHDT